MKKFNVYFKKMVAEDLRLLHLWFHIPHVLKWYCRDDKYTFEKLQEKYLPRIGDSLIPNFIIYDNDKPVGYIQFYPLAISLPEGIGDYSHPLFRDFKPSELAGIDLFIADENYLHRGFGSQGLTLFIDTFISNQYKAVLVDPLTRNSIAISFFTKNGFRNIENQNPTHTVMIKS